MQIIPRVTGTPVRQTQLQLPDLIDIDGSHPQWVQKPTVRVEIRNPRSNQVVTLHNVDSLVRQNSFSQRSQTCDIVAHDVADWTHPSGYQAIHSMYGITVYEGYRGIMIQTFHGWVTEADYSDYPAELRLSCSDLLYLADRFFILSPLSYQNWAADDAIRDLLGRCSIPESRINIGADGSQKLPYGLLPTADTTTGKAGAIFAYQSALTALGHLCDEFGYQYWCDVHGFLEIQLARPFPDSAGTLIPLITTNSVTQSRLRLLSADSAQSLYSNSSLPGNLLKVISHKYNSHDLRNFIGVYDGQDAPYYKSAAPAIPGYPPPHLPTPQNTAGADVTASNNTGVPTVGGVPVFTSSALVASDLIKWGDTVKQDPTDPTNAATTTMQDYLASRILADLNLETESLEVLTFGNPYVDIGQTMDVRDAKSHLSGVFFIQGYQTRLSSAGYTTQITGVGGTPRPATYPRPRPTVKVRLGHDTYLRSIIDWNMGHLLSDGTVGTRSLTLAAGTVGS